MSSLSDVSLPVQPRISGLMPHRTLPVSERAYALRAGLLIRGAIALAFTAVGLIAHLAGI
jgi:hypothetical protein